MKATIKDRPMEALCKQFGMDSAAVISLAMHDLAFSKRMPDIQAAFKEPGMVTCEGEEPPAEGAAQPERGLPPIKKKSAVKKI